MTGQDEGKGTVGGAPTGDEQKSPETTGRPDTDAERADAATPETTENEVPDLAAALQKATAEIVEKKKETKNEKAATGEPNPAEAFDVFKKFVEGVSRAAKALETEAKRRTAESAEKSQAPAQAPPAAATAPVTEEEPTTETPIAAEPEGDKADVIDLEEARSRREKEPREATEAEKRMGRLVKGALQSYVKDNLGAPDEDGNVNIRLDTDTIKRHGPGLLASLFGAIAEAAVPGSTTEPQKPAPETTAPESATKDDAKPEAEAEAGAESDEARPKVKVNLDLSGLMMDLFKTGAKDEPKPAPKPDSPKKTEDS